MPVTTFTQHSFNRPAITPGVGLGNGVGNAQTAVTLGTPQDVFMSPQFGSSAAASPAEKPKGLTLKQVWTTPIKDVAVPDADLKHRHFLLQSEKEWYKVDQGIRSSKIKYEMFKNYSDKPLNFHQRLACRMLWSYQAKTRKSTHKAMHMISDGCAYPHLGRLSCSEHAVLIVQTRGRSIGGFIKALAHIWMYNINCAVNGFNGKLKNDAVGAKEYVKDYKAQPQNAPKPSEALDNKTAFNQAA